jgi:hypothetical protein
MDEIVQRTHGSLKHAQRTQLLFTSQACGKALVRNLFFKKTRTYQNNSGIRRRRNYAIHNKNAAIVISLKSSFRLRNSKLP